MNQFGLFIGTLLQSRTQAHIYHWQTEGEGSYAAHQALGDYYDKIIDFVDDLVESYQGKYGIYKGYVMNNELKEDGNAQIYFEALCVFVEKIRHNIAQDSYLQNQVDEIVALIQKTKYKLSNLR